MLDHGAVNQYTNAASPRVAAKWTFSYTSSGCLKSCETLSRTRKTTESRLSEEAGGPYARKHSFFSPPAIRPVRLAPPPLPRLNLKAMTNPRRTVSIQVMTRRKTTPSLCSGGRESRVGMADPAILRRSLAFALPLCVKKTWNIVVCIAASLDERRRRCQHFTS
uniref:Uncharacterized protein n=1 Tax=Toxoplasma gondii (strain ATCC 50861 / VEG) TaxID=432359 RepID=A0A0F7V9D0_TOXGV|nr:TPA: hypothetical protein BN1205_101680 [Toxoplasma gondii VEG]